MRLLTALGILALAASCTDPEAEAEREGRAMARGFAKELGLPTLTWQERQSRSQERIEKLCATVPEPHRTRLRDLAHDLAAVASEEEWNEAARVWVGPVSYAEGAAPVVRSHPDLDPNTPGLWDGLEKGLDEWEAYKAQ